MEQATDLTGLLQDLYGNGRKSEFIFISKNLTFI